MTVDCWNSRFTFFFSVLISFANPNCSLCASGRKDRRRRRSTYVWTWHLCCWWWFHCDCCWWLCPFLKDRFWESRSFFSRFNLSTLAFNCAQELSNNFFSSLSRIPVNLLSAKYIHARACPILTFKLTISRARLWEKLFDILLGLLLWLISPENPAMKMKKWEILEK